MEMANVQATPGLDGFSYEFARKAQDAAVAARDLAELGRLARMVSEDVDAWLSRLAHVSSARPCALPHAAVMVLGSLFAETLDGPALRVLAAEMVRAMGEQRG